MGYCRTCGKQNTENEKFCAGCGLPTNPAAAPQTTGMKTYNVDGSAPKQTNILAIVGLIVTLAVSPTIGVILSIIGLIQSKEMNGSGRTLAIVGIVIGAILNVVYLILSILMLIFMQQIIDWYLNWIEELIEGASIIGLW